MKKIIALSALLLLIFSSCSTATVADFEQEQAAKDNTAEQIAAHVKGLPQVKDCTADIRDGAVLVSIDLAAGYSDDQIVALKKEITRDIKARYRQINHVTISTALDIYEKTQDGDGTKTGDEKQVEKELENNRGKEIFDIPAPTV